MLAALALGTHAGSVRTQVNFSHAQAPQGGFTNADSLAMSDRRPLRVVLQLLTHHLKEDQIKKFNYPEVWDRSAKVSVESQTLEMSGYLRVCFDIMQR